VGQALPFADDSFDATVFRASLHHVPGEHMLQALREARRVTRPGGEIFVFEPLTRGSMFDLVKLVDDETEVRTQAQGAIAQAVAEGWLSRRHEAALTAVVVYADLESVRRHIVNIDASRAAAFNARRDEVQRIFESSGEAVDQGRRFEQPFRLDVLA
jgi:ubiquinone/menaquinone biosynthesis C-methylase UbiE